ncbi:MAG: hypothetical protein KF789_00380 [Bdellovibrionaceae bacterium]|nr:hypothetical protein [Pseudobdellovibrionaceae bacterium]
MKPLLAIPLMLLVFSFAGADELTIVDVRRNIPLSDSEPAYKDFYLAGGSVSSLKKNLVVTAVRRTNIRDARGTQSYGEIDIPVGQLRILGVFGNVAVAREYKLLSRDENPMLEQTGLMSGDRIELKGSFVDDKPAAKPKAVSEVETEHPARETASVPVNAPATPAETPAPQQQALPVQPSLAAPPTQAPAVPPTASAEATTASAPVVAGAPLTN